MDQLVVTGYDVKVYEGKHFAEYCCFYCTVLPILITDVVKLNFVILLP